MDQTSGLNLFPTAEEKGAMADEMTTMVAALSQKHGVSPEAVMDIIMQTMQFMTKNRI